MGIYPILGKNWDMNFLLWENIGQKNWENFVLEKIESTILGKYWEILRVHSTRPNFFWIWEIFFQKWENIGNRVVKCFWICPNLGKLKLLFWENIGRSQKFIPLVPIFGKCFSKNGKTLGTELLNVFGFSQI